MVPHPLPDRRPALVPALGGAILLLVGAALLADQLGYVVPYRWAFLVLLVPAAAAIADAARTSAVLGWWHVQPLSRLVAGLLFAAIGMLMYLELNTGVILPTLIVCLGAGTLVRTLLSRP